MSWVVVAILVAGVAILAVVVGQRPEKNVNREGFAHWIESLMRYYEDGASLTIVDKAERTRLRFVLSESKADGCRLRVSVLRTSLSERHATVLTRSWIEECELEGKDDEAVVDGVLNVSSIWASGAGERGAKAAHSALDAMGVLKETRFDLSFLGNRSLKRTAYAREKMKDEI